MGTRSGMGWGPSRAGCWRHRGADAGWIILRVRSCACACVSVLTAAPTSEGHRFPGGQAVSINPTFINGFLSLFDFMRELPATQQRAMGIDNAGGGWQPCPAAPRPLGPSPVRGQSTGEAAWQRDAGLVLSGAEGVTGSRRFPCQPMGPWEHQGGQEERGAQVITSNTFVRASGAPNIGGNN